MFTNKYPYTDFHELNADWLLKNVAPLPKEFNDLKSAVKTELDDIESELDNVESELDDIESELDNKVDKIPGKGLSTNDFTDADKTKLDGIEAGAQVNVQSDWDEDNASSDAYILNKPYVPAPIIDTASGSVASFPDGAPAPVISLSVDINAVQSGSGTPSPSNIRPISGWDVVNVVVSPTTDAQDGTTTTINLGSTIYGGTLDVTSGVLTVTHGYIASYNEETLPGTWISDRDVYAEGTTPTIGAEVVYKLAAPITVTLDPAQVEVLLGTNNIWANSGDISVTYIADTKLYIDKVLGG